MSNQTFPYRTQNSCGVIIKFTQITVYHLSHNLDPLLQGRSSTLLSVIKLEVAGMEKINNLGTPSKSAKFPNTVKQTCPCTKAKMCQFLRRASRIATPDTENSSFNLHICAGAASLPPFLPRTNSKTKLKTGLLSKVCSPLYPSIACLGNSKDLFLYQKTSPILMELSPEHLAQRPRGI